ncbi:MAG TPA: hypothetical protein VMS14_00760 [Ilumatobacteraceae bacterium]|nr:hypothetical protein [Ilumatobacteraceae bacterium]
MSAVIDVPTDRDVTVVVDQLAAGLADLRSRVEGRRLWLTCTLSDRTDVARFLPSGLGDRQFILRRV